MSPIQRSRLFNTHRHKLDGLLLGSSPSGTWASLIPAMGMRVSHCMLMFTYLLDNSLFHFMLCKCKKKIKLKRNNYGMDMVPSEKGKKIFRMLTFNLWRLTVVTCELQNQEKLLRIHVWTHSKQLFWKHSTYRNINTSSFTACEPS